MKPSGAEFHGSIGVSYHDVTDVTSITTAATFLLKQLEPRNSVLVESFIDTLRIQEPGTCMYMFLSFVFKTIFSLSY